MNEQNIGRQPPLNVPVELAYEQAKLWKQRALAAEAELQQLNKRERLVQRVVEMAGDGGGSLGDPAHSLRLLREAAFELGAFKLSASAAAKEPHE